MNSNRKKIFKIILFCLAFFSIEASAGKVSVVTVVGTAFGRTYAAPAFRSAALESAGVEGNSTNRHLKERGFKWRDSPMRTTEKFEPLTTVTANLFANQYGAKTSIFHPPLVPYHCQKVRRF